MTSVRAQTELAMDVAVWYNTRDLHDVVLYDTTRSASITGPLADVYDFVVWKLLEAKNRRRAESVSNAIRAFGPIVDAFDGAIGVARAH